IKIGRGLIGSLDLIGNLHVAHYLGFQSHCYSKKVLDSFAIIVDDPEIFQVRSRIFQSFFKADKFYDFGTQVQLVTSEEHTSELQSRENLVCRVLLEKK